MTHTPTTTTDKLGTLIVNRDGHTSGPRYGQVYTAPAGGRGFIAGVRDAATGDALCQREWFARLSDATDYLVRIGAY